ncbi:Integral membrane protein [Echinococcus granulosus]|uniref:Integral membrane protein GPR155 n=1 Tax=Echinococcus granulosus TaxID=6210 RepID=A0A068WET1_ECHGR|nr:Integral membrane protein [Echinococcus granulosus]CDS18604.1 integral membrane protein GPR155 [Echinococcus granulosus]
MSLSVPLPAFDSAIFRALVPVLIQCFGLILLGFLAGELKLLTNTQAKGLGIYVTSFALPAVFFTVMVSMDFSGVDWYFVMAVSLGKVIIFLLTMIIVLVVSRGKSIGLAGLLAIFTSQSNDVALAYPVLRLLYPDLAAYIYLFAPAQLVILNPLGYFALEWHKAKERAVVDSVIASHFPASSQSTFTLACKRILNVVRQVALNPLLFMTLIGVIFNFIFKHKLPDMAEGFFKDLGASFSATALFYLGFSMVRRIKRIDRRGIYILISILVGKVIISPFITREMMVLLLSHQPKESSVPKSSFAFLYAAAPTAPPVFLFASNSGILPEVIGAGLVIGTFLYAPIMFIFAGMATLVHVDLRYYDGTLEQAAVYLSWASLLCCVWTLAILAVTKKANRMPYRFLVCVIVSVMVFCSSLVVGSLWEPITWDREVDTTWSQYIKFIVFFFACTGSRVWTAFLCIALLLQIRRRRPLSIGAQIVFYALGFVIPVVSTLILTLTAQPLTSRDINPAFHYGTTQQICSMVLLVICLSTSLLAFLCIFRSKSVVSRRHLRYSKMRIRLRSLTSKRSRSHSNFAGAVDATETTREVEYAPLLPPETGDEPELSHLNEPVSPDEEKSNSSDLLHSSPHDGALHQHENEVADLQEKQITTSPVERTEYRNSSVASSNKSDSEEAFQEDDLPPPLSNQSEVPNLHRFFILIILLMISMFFGICICLWRLVREMEAGVFVVVEFIDQIFNFGQGILIFAVFGIDTELIINPLANCISTMRYWMKGNLSSRSLRLARQVKEEDVEQFVATHLSECMKQICTSLPLPDKTLESVFYFEDFHRWTSRKFATEGRYQSREATSSLLMALTTMHLIRRLSSRSAGIGRQAVPESSTSDLIHYCGLEDSPILFQYL